MPTIYAIILNWNQPDDTLICLASLQAQTAVSLELILVDNASHDDSVVRIKAAYPHITVLENEENLGFAGGMNRGIRHALAAGADYLFVLNNDTYLADDALAHMMVHTSADVGLIAPIIYYADAPTRVWSLGGKVHPWTLETVGTFRGQVDQGEWPTVITCDFVPGCAMLLSRQLLTQVGLFDDAFFMYYEDCDLCYRIRQAGFAIHSITTAKMWHKVALSSGGSDSPNERYWMARSSLYFFRKHGRGWQRPIILFWRTGSAVRTTWRLARRRQWDSLRAYWRGLWHGYKKL